MKEQSTLNAYIYQAMVDNCDRQSLSNLKAEDYTYYDVACNAARFHLMFKEMGIEPGSRVAFCGKNSARWAMAFIGCITYGAVVVPILHEFTPESIHHLVDHSDSVVLLVDESIWSKLDPSLMPRLKVAIRLSDYRCLYSPEAISCTTVDRADDLFKMRYGEAFKIEDLKVYEPASQDDLAIINYTSGSTGNSKGVMLSYRNLWSNIQYSIDGLTFLEPGDGMVCMLPLAHMFGLAFEMLHPFVKGCHIYFITKVPSPRVLLEAFNIVKPKLIITVPLVLEKVIKSKVFPVINRPLMKVLLHLPIINNIIYKKILGQLIDGFGGNLREVIIGGAGLNKDIEKFLRRVKFPYTVGYGMTECAPIVAYVPWELERPMSCGRVVDRMQVRVDSSDPSRVPGVLWVKGDNVMKGYYKNEKATADVMDDGWMNTGDICTIDKDGFIYIKGRDKNMILGPSGQNIYPEEIEQVLNNMPYVSESIVISENGKLVALVHPDMEAVEKDGLSDSKLREVMKADVDAVNQQVSAYSRLSDYRIYREEFAKTPKRSIKRYLYQK